MIMLLLIYVIVAALSYSYLMGSGQHEKGFSPRKCIFSIMWPIHALHAYTRMLKGWDKESNDD